MNCGFSYASDVTVHNALFSHDTCMSQPQYYINCGYSNASYVTVHIALTVLNFHALIIHIIFKIYLKYYKRGQS